MKSFKSLTLGCTILIASAFYMPAKAQSLEVVFKDTLWGIAIGTTVMFVVWATDEEPETNKLGTKLLQGVAYGTGVGLAYGLWDANRDSGLISQRRGLLQYDAKVHRLTVAPAEAFLPPLETEGRGIKLSLFSARF